MNLFLIGYRCSGKTTIGKSVAESIGWSFVDADNMLVEECGKQIKDIVDTDGWEAFRHRERSMLMQICKKKRQVVATGGGVVLDAENVRTMHASGIIIGLGATAETIRKRLLQDINTANFRPALTDKGLVEEIEDMLSKRNPDYENASDFFIQTDDIPVIEITQRIIQKIKHRIGE
ncbi:MAG: shikimate kinase [Desulfobacterales bacterium]|jgi:shikimate kinase